MIGILLNGQNPLSVVKVFCQIICKSLATSFIYCRQMSIWRKFLFNLRVCRVCIGFAQCWGEGGRLPPPILQYFWKHLSPVKPMLPHGVHLPPKNEPPPSEKQPLSPQKHEAHYHKMIPKRSTINNNLKYSSNL